MSTDPTPFPTATQAAAQPPAIIQTREWLRDINLLRRDIRRNTFKERVEGELTYSAVARKSRDLRMAALKLDEAVLHLEAELERLGRKEEH